MQHAPHPPTPALPDVSDVRPEVNRLLIGLGVITGGAASFAFLLLAAHWLTAG